MTGHMPYRLSNLQGARILIISTVAQSLALQMPDAWNFLRASGASLTFASSADGWETGLTKFGTHLPIRSTRKLSIHSLMQTRNDLDEIIRASQWGLIQVQTPIVGALARTIRRRRTPLLYVAHGFHFHRDGQVMTNFAYSGIEVALASRADSIAVVCKEDYDRAKALRLDRQALLWRLPGAGVDLEPFSSRSEDPPNDDRMRILFVGEMNSNKDPLRAIRVAQRLAEHRAVGLVMIGDGPLADEVEDTIAASALEGLLIRRTTHVPKFMHDADVVLAPSRREGLPRVVIEALASGKPVVARSNRGTRELLQGGVGKLMRGEATDDEWASAVTASTLRHDAAAARERASSYSTSRFLTSYRALIEKTLEGGRND